MRVYRSSVVAALLCSLLPSCTSASQAEQSVETATAIQDPMAFHLGGLSAAQREGWHSALASNEEFVLLWRALDAPMVRNEYLELEVELYQAGQPLQEAHLDVLGWMPAHGHGFQRRTEVTGGDSGRFKVSGVLFHMRGSWQLTFDVNHKGSVQKLTFDLEF